MIFRETIQSDLEFMKSHSVNQEVDRKTVGSLDYIYTLEHENRPLLVGGFRMITPSTAWCWIDLSDKCNKKIISVYKVIREWIDIFVKDHDIKRLQAFVRVDYEEGVRLVRHLGFKQEFDKPMKNFFGDEDAYLYVRLT